MKQNRSVCIILSCNVVTQRVSSETNHSNHISIKLHTFTSLLIVHAQKSMRWGHGVAHGDAQMKQNHSVSIISSCDVVTQRISGETNHRNHIPIKLHTFTSVLIVNAQKGMRWGQGVAYEDA